MDRVSQPPPGDQPGKHDIVSIIQREYTLRDELARAITAQKAASKEVEAVQERLRVVSALRKLHFQGVDLERLTASSHLIRIALGNEEQLPFQYERLEDLIGQVVLVGGFTPCAVADRGRLYSFKWAEWLHGRALTNEERVPVIYHLELLQTGKLDALFGSIPAYDDPFQDE